MSGAVTVIQADRDAAAFAIATEKQMHLRDAVRRGDHDRSEAVKAFARYRVASQAELVEVLREILDGHGFLSGGDWELEDIGISQNRGAEIRALLARIEGKSA